MWSRRERDGTETACDIAFFPIAISRPFPSLVSVPTIYAVCHPHVRCLFPVPDRFLSHFLPQQLFPPGCDIVFFPIAIFRPFPSLVSVPTIYAVCHPHVRCLFPSRPFPVPLSAPAAAVPTPSRRSHTLSPWWGRYFRNLIPGRYFLTINNFQGRQP